ncbi:hypothetical protein LINGRAPRIM_LOCUS104 [Linum grandiflorum]
MSQFRVWSVVGFLDEGRIDFRHGFSGSGVGEERNTNKLERQIKLVCRALRRLLQDPYLPSLHFTRLTTTPSHHDPSLILQSNFSLMAVKTTSQSRIAGEVRHDLILGSTFVSRNVCSSHQGGSS